MPDGRVALRRVGNAAESVVERQLLAGETDYEEGCGILHSCSH